MQQKQASGGHKKKIIIVTIIVIVLAVAAAVTALVVLLPRHPKNTSTASTFTGSPVQKDVTLDVQKTIADANLQANDNQYTAAVATLDAALSSATKNSDKGALYAAKADALWAAGNTSQALQAAQQAVTFAPSVPNYGRLGDLYKESGQKEQAIAAYQKELAAYDKQIANGGQQGETFGRNYYVQQITELGGAAS